MRSNHFQKLFLLGLIIIPGILFARGLILKLTRTPPNYSQVEGRLWLGGAEPVPPADTEVVINLSPVNQNKYDVQVHRWLDVADAGAAPPVEWLQEQVATINEQLLLEKTVYVYDSTGNNQAAFLVLAYIMFREKMTVDRAYGYLKARRESIAPARHFLDRLKDWEDFLKKPPEQKKE
ncbi:MAG: dual specificity protein phosphatase [Zavarzinella sp.]